MPQDEIEWHGTGRGASKPAGRVADPHEEAGARAHILAQEDQDDGHRQPGGGTVFTSSAGSKSRLRKTPMTTTTMSGEAHPTGQRTRVMDMKMSLTRQRRDGGAHGGRQPGCTCGVRQRLRG